MLYAQSRSKSVRPSSDLFHWHTLSVPFCSRQKVRKKIMERRGLCARERTNKQRETQSRGLIHSVTNAPRSPCSFFINFTNLPCSPRFFPSFFPRIFAFLPLPPLALSPSLYYCSPRCERRRNSDFGEPNPTVERFNRRWSVFPVASSLSRTWGRGVHFEGCYKGLSFCGQHKTRVNLHLIDHRAAALCVCVPARRLVDILLTAITVEDKRSTLFRV